MNLSKNSNITYVTLGEVKALFGGLQYPKCQLPVNLILLGLKSH